VEVDDEAQRVQQQPRREAGDVRAVALAHVEDADQRQGLDRLAQRVARQPESFGEVSLPGSRSPGRRSPATIIALIFSIASSVTATCASLFEIVDGHGVPAGTGASGRNRPAATRSSQSARAAARRPPARRCAAPGPGSAPRRRRSRRRMGGGEGQRGRGQRGAVPGARRGDRRRPRHHLRRRVRILVRQAVARLLLGQQPAVEHADVDDGDPTLLARGQQPVQRRLLQQGVPPGHHHHVDIGLGNEPVQHTRVLGPDADGPDRALGRNLCSADTPRRGRPSRGPRGRGSGPGRSGPGPARQAVRHGPVDPVGGEVPHPRWSAGTSKPSGSRRPTPAGSGTISRLGDADRGTRPRACRRIAAGRLIVPDPAGVGRRDPEGFDVPADHRRVWDFTADGVNRSVADSLSRLGLDRIDLVLIHDPEDHRDGRPRRGVSGAAQVAGRGRGPGRRRRVQAHGCAEPVRCRDRYRRGDGGRAVHLAGATGAGRAAARVPGAWGRRRQRRRVQQRAAGRGEPRDGLPYEYADAPPEMVARASAIARRAPGTAPRCPRPRWPSPPPIPPSRPSSSGRRARTRRGATPSWRRRAAARRALGRPGRRGPVATRRAGARGHAVTVDDLE